MTYKVYTDGSGTFTVPTDVWSIKVTLVGGGGGGSGAAQCRQPLGGDTDVYEGGGGGAGASFIKTISTTPGATFSYSVGTGGAGGNSAYSMATQIESAGGSDGGDTTFGIYYAGGGKGGVKAYASGYTGSYDGKGGAGGSTGTSGFLSGGAGGAVANAGSGYRAGTSSTNRGGGGGGIAQTAGSVLSSAGYGSYGGSGPSEGSGKNGSYGGGGSGATTAYKVSGSYTGGTGGSGIIIIEYTTVSKVTVSFSASNGSVSSSSVSVPYNSSYSISGSTVTLKYQSVTVATVTGTPSSGYGNPSWAVSGNSGSVFISDGTCAVTYTKVTYSGTVHLGSNYVSFRIISPSAYAGVYYNSASIQYESGAKLDVDWTGATVTSEGTYVKTVTSYKSTNYEQISYSDGTSDTTKKDGRYLSASNSSINPNPSSAEVSSESKQYRCYVSFNSNGGTGSVPSSGYSDWSSSKTSIYYSWGSTQPTKSGYAFLGWSTSGSAATPEYTGTYGHFTDKSYTLYAVWQQIPDTYYSYLYYDANGGSGGPSGDYSSTSATSQPSSRTVTITSSAPTKSGHAFLGWSTSSTATTASYTAGDTITVPYVKESTTGITLYAVWQAGAYAITVSASPSAGGTVSGGGNYLYGRSITISASAYSNYIFTQWSDGNTSASRTVTVSGDKSYIAYFRKKVYTVRFRANNGTSESKSQTFEIDESKALTLNAFSYISRRFLGWSASSTATAATYADGATVSGLSSTDGAVVDLYAVWEYVEPSNPGEITLKIWNGSSNERVTYSDMIRIESAVNTLSSCIGMSSLTWSTTPSRAGAFDYRDAVLIEQRVKEISDLRGLNLTVFTGWYAGYRITYGDMERIESNLYAIYRDFGGTSSRIDA